MNEQEINKEFVHYLRLNGGITIWYSDDPESSEIVPNQLTHGYLLENFNIDYSVLKFYFLNTRGLMSDSEYQKKVESGFIGEKETALFPYSIVIYRAYFSRSDLFCKLSKIASGSFPIIGVKYFSDLNPYFKEYSNGFRNGFNEFENNQIKPFLTMFPDKQDYLNKVFEYITKDKYFQESWATSRTGFKVKVKSEQENELIGAFEHGQYQGYFYRAWSIVFSNNKLFAPLFEEYFKPDLTQQTNVTENEILKIGNITFTEFSNTKEALSFLKSYELKEENKGQKKWLFDSIDLSLFELEFNVYLENELNVEIDEALGCIKNYSNYLNSQTILGFFNHQKKKAENNLEKFENEKTKIHNFLNDQQQISQSFEEIEAFRKAVELIPKQTILQPMVDLQKAFNKVEFQSKEPSLDLSMFKQKKNESIDQFHFFDKYFKVHQTLMLHKTTLLSEFKKPTAEYFVKIREKENDIENISSEFIKEIRNNVLKIDIDKKFYLEQIQTKLNGIYESTEEHRKNSPELEFLEFHDSLVSIQNLIRDIAIKNKISIFGDETGLTSQRQSESKTDKLKVPQIALIHIYKDIQITEENAKEIAAEYGYTSKTSGTGLYHDYLKYCKTSDRIAKPSAETKKTLINKIELFESVVNHLSDKAKNMANDEIKILKTILETEYS